METKSNCRVCEKRKATWNGVICNECRDQIAEERNGIKVTH